MTDFASRISRGNLFHKRRARPRTVNIRNFFLTAVQDVITSYFSDLSVCWRFSKCNKSLTYEGVLMNSALYVRKVQFKFDTRFIKQIMQ